MKSLELKEMEVVKGGKVTGKGVMNCVVDAYSNHGWASLALFALSAVEPVGIVYTAAMCAAKNH